MAPDNHAQLTPCSNLEPRQLLEYVPAHHIVICKICSYAIQPLAISRHLKNYHQIYRGTRRPFMRYVASLDLREPQDVVIRTIPEDPIPFLPVVNGFACCIPNCRYISISVKLMTTHCNNKHQTVHQTDARWRHARLQTFFRGNRTKYFEVSQTDPGQGWSASRNSKERTQDIKDTNGLPGAYRISPCPDGNATNGLNLDTVDLALLQHFRESTCSSLSSDPLVQKIWRTVVPEMAYTNLYLMQGLLACSALHLADLQPARRRELTIRAVSHQDKALPLFRAVIPGINDLNCHAAYAFCHLLIIFAYASQDKAKYFSLAQQDLENDTSSYLHLIHGGCSILISVKSVIETGPLRWLIPDDEHADNSTYCEDSRLKSLGFLSSLEPDDAWQGMAPAVYLDAFFKLRTTFHRAYTRGALLTIWDIVHAWPAQVPDDFLRLLSDEHPGALILIAHYCILLRRLESYWYMKGYAAGLLSRIQSRIGQKWYNWIAWPLQDIGMEERSIGIHPASQHLRMTDQS